VRPDRQREFLSTPHCVSHCASSTVIPPRPAQEDELAIVKLHDLVSKFDACCVQPAHLGFNVFDCKADMIEAELV